MKRNPYIITVKRKPGMIDLTNEGRVDWFAASLREEKENRLKTTNGVEVEGARIEEYDLPYPQSVPVFSNLYPQKETVSLWEILFNIDYSKLKQFLP